jgi:hypothetical protein
MDLSQHLLQLEQRLLSRAVRQAPAELARLLADDFLEFGASGGVWDKSDILEALPKVPFTQRIVSQFNLKWSSENSALVTYHCHNVAADRPVAADSWRSSLWRLEHGEWRMVFHQGTYCARAGDD